MARLKCEIDLVFFFSIFGPLLTVLLNNSNRAMFKPICSLYSVDLRIGTGFLEDSFRETHLWEHFGRTGKIALVTCLKHLNVSGAFLIRVRALSTLIGNGKAHEENPQREFRRESGRGSGREVSGPEFFIINYASFSQRNAVHQRFEWGAYEMSIFQSPRKLRENQTCMRQIVITVLCCLRSPFPEEGAIFRYRKLPFLWVEVLLLLQHLQHESTVFPYQEMAGSQVLEGGCIRVKQVRFGKLAFLQQNGSFFGPKICDFRPFGTMFQWKKLVHFCANNGVLAPLVLWFFLQHKN